MPKLFKRIRNNRGLATLITLFMMIMLTTIGLAAIMMSSDEMTIANNETNEMAAFYAAEAGLERASATIQDQFESTGYPPTVMPTGNENVGSNVIAYSSIDHGAAVQRPLTQGTMAGLNASVKTYTINSVGTATKDFSTVTLSMEFEAALVPIFQFAVFYDNDLEISPGPDMSILGRVHTNGDLWLNPYDDLNMDSYVTSVGDIRHGPRGSYASVRSGDVFIKDTDGNYQNMKNSDGTWLDSNDPDWYNKSAQKWDGRVQDAAYGQQTLNMPITSNDPHDIIDRYESGANPDSYETKAEAKVIDGKYLIKVGGVWTDVTASLPANTITTGSFYDQREKEFVATTDVDMSLLKTSSYFPSNGVLYASDRRAGSFNALRLTNGSDLGSGLSVFCENPMYIEGDYNSVNKQPAALCADAVTFLSNNWNDANAGQFTSFSNRIATATTCNASIITGNTTMTGTVDNGGLENLPRFLEDWDYSVPYTISGSLVNLWHSEQADGAWKVGSPVYRPPVRNWSYDTDLDDPSKLPPATPMIQIFLRTGWRQLDVAHTTDSVTVGG